MKKIIFTEGTAAVFVTCGFVISATAGTGVAELTDTGWGFLTASAIISGMLSFVVYNLTMK